MATGSAVSPAADRFLLAVVGSGSKTQALLTDLRGKAIARGFGPASNPNVVGFEAFGRALTMAIEGALVNAMGPRRGDADGAAWRGVGIASACFGLAGVDSPEDEARVSRWVREQAVSERTLVVNDAALVMAGGTPDGWGVALISGSGSVCYGRSAQGREVRVGGWGPLLGDEGSGYEMALGALRLCTQTADGRADAHALLQAILRHWSLPDASALLRHVYRPGTTPGDLAALAPVIVDLAASGDADARALVEATARGLARQVDTAVRKLALERPPLALAGSSLQRGDMRRALLSAVSAEIGTTAYVPDLCRGAVKLAERLLKGPQAGR
ncbi:MAG TPA: BadF/BadG/BcrA/BcrD ATPase family protein [Vicinamibacteria bacterium]|nr:BadF/BadG/BcrA/BcrD ATPase family protein [Vicinamibacteria bacterium]